jgi:threonine/homoserine efflux transporter RhtA
VQIFCFADSIATADVLAAARIKSVNMAVISFLLLSILCIARGELLFPYTTPGWDRFCRCGSAVRLRNDLLSVSIIGPVRASLLYFIEPIVVASLGVILLGEPLMVVQIAGVALAIIALISVTASR